jgi:ATP synthase protein I
MAAILKNTSGLLCVQSFLRVGFGVGLLLALLAFLLLGQKEGTSALLACFVSVIPGVFFARHLFKHHGALAAKQIAANFYRGEALKIFVSMVLFTAAFRLFTLDAPIFFAVYILVNGATVFAPLILGISQCSLFKKRLKC